MRSEEIAEENSGLFWCARLCDVVGGWPGSGTRPKPEWQPRKEVYEKGVVPSTVRGVDRTGRILILSPQSNYISTQSRVLDLSM